ncbi:Zinc resistance conferring protein, variant 2 [Basidiobolus ranarum]|uniref:Zinc resistance conferring protein, variant 2 n=1 Tax=Basidiobolus ranarum TaxID=34480 RepID=A0ABR2WK91_9FUNG
MSRTGCLQVLFIFTLIFFSGQVLLGCASGSLALVAESFHSLSVSICLYVTLYSSKLAEQNEHSSQYTYGWQRAEILGTLLNGIILTALSFAVVLNVIQRCFHSKEMEIPQLVFATGALSLLVNIVTMLLFRESTYLYLRRILRDKSHSSIAPTAFSSPNQPSCQFDETAPLLLPQFDRSKQSTSFTTGNSMDQTSYGKRDLMWYSYHLLSSTFGSVVLLITSGITWSTLSQWRFLADLIGGLVIALVHLVASIPLVIKAARMLMQGLPNAIPFDLIRDSINEIPGILAVQEFHLWQPGDATTAASIRVKVVNATSYSPIERKIQEILQSYGIHSFTVEPEFMNSYRDVLARTTKEKVDSSSSSCFG